MSVLDRLNAQQRLAAETTEGPVVILAGAGSGKTGTLTARCAHIIEERGVSSAAVCLMTFTNKAAREMKGRIATMASPDRTRGLWAGTFHSLCGRILRKHAMLVDRRADFAIYDDDDQRSTVKQAIDEACEGNLDEWQVDLVKDQIGLKKQDGLRPADLVSDSSREKKFREIWETYERMLVCYNAMDFESMILLTCDLLRREDDVGRLLRSKFRYVMVDEFQDTNKTQYELVRLLSENNNLCVVGDDDQSVYGWRGADVKIIRTFQEVYPAATVVKLEQNYRSTKRIVAAAHAVIQKGKDRLDKKLWTANPEGAKVLHVTAPNEYEEARFVAERIRTLVRAGKSPEEMAILYRSHVQSRALEEALVSYKIAYRIVGGFGFYDRKEIKAAMAYLRLAVNPDSDIDVARVINLPPRGVGPGTLKKMREAARARKTSMWAVMPYLSRLGEIRPREQRGISDFYAQTDRLRREASSLHCAPPSDFAAAMIGATGLKRMWLEEENEKRQAGKNKEASDAGDRASNLDSLVDAMASYERRQSEFGEAATLRGYLEMVALITKEKEATERDEQKVTLTTVHAAKGLEFDCVWIVAMEEGRFPSYRSIGDPAQEEEERRLAYVAITRARKQLCLTSTCMRTVFGKPEICTKSRFAKDIADAEGAVEYLSTDEYRQLAALAAGGVV